MSPIKTLFYSMPLTILLATAFAAPGLALAPVAQKSNPVPAVRRSQCVSTGAPLHIEWAIYVVNTTRPSRQGSGTWGGGLLDNFNGKAGCVPTSWQAQFDDADPQGVGCTVNQISDAIHTASSENNQKIITSGGGQWLYCEGDILTDLFDTTGAVLSGLAQDLGAVAG